MATLSELTTPQTADEIKASIYADAAAEGLPTTSWKPGAVVRTIIAIFSKVLSAASSLQALIARSGFLELSSGDWLALVAFYVYGVTKNEGTFATGSVTVDNTGGGVYSGDPDDLVFLNTAVSPPKAYRNTAAFSIGALETGVVIPVQAVEIGSDSNAGVGDITTLETTLLGVVIDTNTAIVGTDIETDSALRTRCREKTGVLSPNGPRDAYAFVARSALRLDGTAIGVTRVTTVPDGSGGIDVYVATAAGTVTGTVGDTATDLGKVADDIHKQAEPLGITPDVQSATAEAIDVTYELWVRDTSGLTNSQIEDAIDDALTDFMAGQPIGGVVIPPASGLVYVEAIKAAIENALTPGTFLDLDLTLPAADVAVVVPEAPVIGTLTATAIHQIAEGEV